MSILITGAGGFIGKVLFRHLSSSRKVIGLSRSGKDTDENIFAVDLSNEAETLDFFKRQRDKKITCVVHLASRIASVKTSEDISIITENLSMAKNLALAVRQENISHVIHVSSSSVYPNVDGLFNESSPVDPSQNSDCLYGLSKYNAEVILSYYLKKNTNLTHLRPAMVHGPGMDETRIIPALKNELRQNNSVTLFGNGERILNLVDVEKLVQVIEFFITHPTNGVFNVVEECISLNTLAQKIINESGNKQSQIILKQEGNKNKFRLDGTKLNQKLMEKNV